MATDSPEVYDVVRAWGGNAIMTSPDCTCGTERIASIVDELDAGIIVNVQGDEPMIEPELIDNLISVALKSDADMVTPVTKINETSVLMSPNTVKVVRSFDGRALYFSRSPVPFIRGVDPGDWVQNSDFWLQIGTYAFVRNALKEYTGWIETPLEALEKVEQLRFLEHGKRILTFAAESQSMAVDVPEDLEEVRKRMKNQERN